MADGGVAGAVYSRAHEDAGEKLRRTTLLLAVIGTALIGAAAMFVANGMEPATPIEGDERDNRLTGTARSDTMRGFDGDDRMEGMGGNDRMEGMVGRDDVYGGGGRDRIDGGSPTTGHCSGVPV